MSQFIDNFVWTTADKNFRNWQAEKGIAELSQFALCAKKCYKTPWFYWRDYIAFQLRLFFFRYGCFSKSMSITTNELCTFVFQQIKWFGHWRGSYHVHSFIICNFSSVGNVELTRWDVSIMWIISHEPPLGSAPQWRLSATTSSGSTSATSCRVPCSSLTRGLYLGWAYYFLFFFVFFYYIDRYCVIISSFFWVLQKD